MKFLKNVDLTNNQLMNAALQNLASDGTPTTYGMIWFNTATNLVKYNAGNGSTLIRYLLHDGLLGAASGIATLDANVRLVQAASIIWDGIGNRSASATPSNNTVIVSGATGKLAYGWFPTMDLLFANAAPTASVAFNGQRLTGILCDTSSSATDAATRGYVDGIAQGLKAKQSVKAATLGTETYVITSGVTISLTGTTVDGVTVSVNDRILVKDAPAASGVGSVGSSQPGNGIYYVTSASGPITLTRALDMDAWAEVPNAYTWVEEGTQADTAYVCSSNVAGTLNTTAITFTKFATATGSASNIAGGAANQIVVQTGTGATGFVSTANNAIFVTNGSGVPSWQTAAIGVANGGTGVATFTAGYIKSSGGTNALSTLATIPSTDGGTGWNSSAITGMPYISSGTWGSATGANIAGIIGTTTITNATNAVHLTSTTVNGIPYQSASATTSFMAAAANSVLVTNGSNVPSLSRTLPALLSVSTAATIAAAGSTQATGTALTSDVNIITTVAASTGVILPTAIAGMRVTVINKGANTLTIYPATGASIDVGAANAGITCPVNGMLEFSSASATTWYSTTNTVIPGVGSATNLTGGGTNQIVYQSTTGNTAYVATSGAASLLISASTGAAPTWSTSLPIALHPAMTGGDVTSSAGSGTLTIGANKVTLAQMATVATQTILGRTTASTGNVEALTGTQARAVIGATTKVSFTWLLADGATKSCAHNLNTLDVQVVVYDSVAAGGNQVFTDVVVTDVNTITVSAAAAPAVSYRVVIIG